MPRYAGQVENRNVERISERPGINSRNSGREISLSTEYIIFKRVDVLLNRCGNRPP